MIGTLLDKINSENIRYDIIYLIDDFITELERRSCQSDIIRNRHLTLEYRGFIEYLEKLKKLILIDPRFNWKRTQAIIDDLYKRDPQIIGVRVLINFIELKKDPENYIPKIYGTQPN